MPESVDPLTCGCHSFASGLVQGGFQPFKLADLPLLEGGVGWDQGLGHCGDRDVRGPDLAVLGGDVTSFVHPLTVAWMRDKIGKGGNPE